MAFVPRPGDVSPTNNDPAAAPAAEILLHRRAESWLRGAVLKARNDRGLVLLWVLVFDCLWKVTPLDPIQSALPTSEALEDMSEAKKSKAPESPVRKDRERVQFVVRDPGECGVMATSLGSR